MPYGSSAHICLFLNGAESLTRAGKAEWAGAPATGLSACGSGGLYWATPNCARSGD